MPGDVVALLGELGTGKTQFIKGVAAGVGIKKPTYVRSPSFTLINEYVAEIPFYHIDLYRLKSEKEAEELGLEEFFQGNGITVVEWADKIPTLLPNDILWVRIRYTGKHTRSVEVLGIGKRYEELLKSFESGF
jgi:tRNA threonylcarbamoyladenosine biosynthesis protein TsaE